MGHLITKMDKAGPSPITRSLLNIAAAMNNTTRWENVIRDALEELPQHLNEIIDPVEKKRCIQHMSSVLKLILSLQNQHCWCLFNDVQQSGIPCEHNYFRDVIDLEQSGFPCVRVHYSSDSETARCASRFCRELIACTAARYLGITCNLDIRYCELDWYGFDDAEGQTKSARLDIMLCLMNDGCLAPASMHSDVERIFAPVSAVCSAPFKASVTDDEPMLLISSDLLCEEAQFPDSDGDVECTPGAPDTYHEFPDYCIRAGSTPIHISTTDLLWEEDDFPGSDGGVQCTQPYGNGDCVDLTELFSTEEQPRMKQKRKRF